VSKFNDRKAAIDLYTKVVITTIALLLGLIATRLYDNPPVVEAQSDQSVFYIEPRVTMLRKPDDGSQIQGKVVIDKRTGDIWGFPTGADAPYPIDLAHSNPPVTTPIYLGRFDFSRMTPAEREKSFKR
jgi:hypothetical protein